MEATKEMVEEWLKLQLKTHSYASSMTYYSFLHRFIGEKIEITQKITDKFRDEHLSTPSSAALKSFFKFLVRRKGFPEDLLNIRFDKNKQTKRFPKSIPINEVNSIIEHMETMHTKVLTRTIFEGALRISEALKLRWSNINWSEWLLNQEDFATLTLLKTKRGNFRVIPIPADLAKLLYRICENKNEQGIPISSHLTYESVSSQLIFDSFNINRFLIRSNNSLDKNIFDYLDYAKITYRRELKKVSKEVIGKHISPHHLRHSRAQSLLDSGMPLDSLKEFLGHSSISTTEIYAHASAEKLKRDMRSVLGIQSQGVRTDMSLSHEQEQAGSTPALCETPTEKQEETLK